MIFPFACLRACDNTNTLPNIATIRNTDPEQTGQRTDSFTRARMLLLSRVIALPTALLGLLLEQSSPGLAEELEWPYNLPPHVKYYPEHEGLVKRNAEIREKLQQQSPVGMRKMSSDPGEMFFLDYWHFDSDHEKDQEYSYNSSITAELAAPFKLHAISRRHKSILPRFLGRTPFDKRDFQCPAGSSACTAIDRPNSCCANGSTCEIVEDVGLGDVGCCPENEVCGGSVSNCPSGYTSCPQNPGGGCCVPGYACFSIGCVATSTVVVVTVVSPTSSSSIPPPASPSTVTQTATQTQISTETQINTQTDTQVETTTIVPVPPQTTRTTVIESSTTTDSVTTTTTARNTITTTSSSTDRPANTLICSSGFRSCPVSLGGGCCPTDRACGRYLCPELSSTNSFTAPARPTSNTVDGTTTSTATGFSSIPGAVCPTGFYACSAFYQGGCCQTGRNCHSTSCPPGESITVVAGSSITVAAPTGDGISSVASALTGSCASGWSTCATDVGGGCCPSGYACGTACTATATGGQNNVVGKIAPNEAGRDGENSRIWLLVSSSFVTIVLFLRNI